jgi:dienelactone hydrolase
VIHTFPVIFHSDGVPLAGRIHRNDPNLADRQPAVAISGSWLTVKEQMPDLYARELAARGYTAMTFDFAGFGTSGGELRQVEMPARKINDITAATRFLQTLACVQADSIGYLGICATAQYAAAAIVRGAPVRSFASVAGWYHDAETVAPYYGGAAGVGERMARAIAAGPSTMVPAYEEGNDRAGMFIHHDYYQNPARGAIKQWRNEMAEMTWLYWLSYDGLTTAERLQVPTLFVHGDECALPDNVKRIHSRMPGPRTLVWEKGYQADFYDRPDLVGLAVKAVDEHFRATLTA